MQWAALFRNFVSKKIQADFWVLLTGKICQFQFDQFSQQKVNQNGNAVTSTNGDCLPFTRSFTSLVNAPDFQYEHEAEWPQAKCIVYE